MSYASNLSLAAAALYALVAGICAFAALHSARAPAWHRAVWLGLVALFVLLIVTRLLSLEDLLRAEFRDALKGADAYASRRTLQAGLTLVLIVAILATAIAVMRRVKGQLRSKRARAVILAALAGAGMVGLVMLRLISHHATDALLYGPLKLNWIGDIGLAAIVLLSAGAYTKRARGARV